MAEFTTALMTQLQRAVDTVRDAIAKDGLKALQSVLRQAGFDKSDYLRDYELYAHVGGDGEIVYEIVLSAGAVEDETDLSAEVAAARKEAMENAEAKFEEAILKSYGLSSDGAVRRISSLRDKRHTSRDTKKPSKDTKKRSRDTKRGSEVREFDHKAAAAAPRALGAPRSMQIGRSGKLHISFTRKLRATPSGFNYPSQDFEGIMKQFIDRLQDVILQNFVPEVEKILSRYTE